MRDYKFHVRPSIIEFIKHFGGKEIKCETTNFTCGHVLLNLLN